MITSSFGFDLPKELIAQTPANPRSSSKLMVLGRFDGEPSHHHFYELSSFLRPQDLLVLNDSKVLPARLFGLTEKNSKVIEILLLKQKHNNTWEVLVRPGKSAKIGTSIIFDKNLLIGKVVHISESGTRYIEFDYSGDFLALLERLGNLPLPPYIKKKPEDPNSYQTVYSKVIGSSAAPTAGLHFTKEMLNDLETKKIAVEYLTLHVGLGTFQPVKTQNIVDHKMHSEYFSLPQKTANAIKSAKAGGGRVIAVGTTCCRALESAGKNSFPVEAYEGETDIFIFPGFNFKVIDGLITNFHLPQSTLLMLVSALAGKSRILSAYEEAIKNEYRFFSFGDAMLIL
jgi:S-adenosylmethionine:tRNA ribosyltransferase-isomerase